MATRPAPPIRIGDVRYHADLSGFVRQPLASIRQMQDQGTEPGEQSLDNQGIWKRTQTDFVLGIGQKYFDQEQESSRRRGRQGRAIDILSDRRQIKTIKKAHLKGTLTGSDLQTKVRRTSSNFWIGNTSGIYRTNSLTDFTLNAITGGPSSLRSMVAFDAYVYVAYSTNDIYRGTVSGSTVSLWSTVDCSLLEVCHGRMVGAQLSEIFELDTSGAKTSIYTHGDANFRWFAFCAAPNGIYAAGTNGTRTEIHLITVVDATGALAPPIPVAELPAGEYVNRMSFFGGYLFLATNKGVRIGNIIGSGSVVYGPLLQFGNVRSLHSDGRFAYFAWDNQDPDGAYGLGRLSLERFTSELVPAYAPDIAVTGSGLTGIYDVSSDSEVPMFVGIDGSDTKIYGPHTTDYEVGKFYSGKITYGTPERKAVVSLDASWDALPTGASVKVEIYDAATGVNYGGINNSTTGSTSDHAVPTVPLEAEEFEIVVTLTPNPSTPTSPVTFRRWTLRVIPMPFKAEEIIIPILASERVELDDGAEAQYDPWEVWSHLWGLMQSRSRVPVQIGREEFTGYVDAVAINPQRGGDGALSWTQGQRWLNGTVLVRIITAEDGV